MAVSYRSPRGRGGSHCYTFAGTLEFRYLAIEGPVGLGKTLLATRLGARLNATVIRDQVDNPFLPDFYAGRSGAAFQSQLVFTLARHRQLVGLRQQELFSEMTICDYLFERDRLYACINLDDNELFVYQRVFDLLASDVPTPDLVVYLQAPTEAIAARLDERARREADVPEFRPSDEYLTELNEAYNHFFFHYTASPLLVVETSQVDVSWGDDAIDELVRQIKAMGRGTKYFVPRTR